jgi:branched-chain amino acid transport system permease protein
MGFLQHLINGMYIGAIYAVIALGYTMVYGIAKMLNFAHGDVIMVGAYISYSITSALGLGVIPGILAAMVVCTLLGILIEGLAYKPLRGTSSLAVLITAIGVSYFLQNGAQLIWGPANISFDHILNVKPLSFFDGRVLVSAEAFLTLVVAVLVMVGLTLFVNKTKMGKAMRAVSEDRAAAQLMGINVNRTISVTFAIGSALAAIAGVLLCSKVSSVYPTVGAMPGIRAFTAAVFGGIGSIPGAMLGGMLMGLIETFGSAYIDILPSDAIVFIVLIIILLVKPAGLLGKQVQEKV